MSSKFCYFDWEVYPNYWFVVFKDQGGEPFLIDSQKDLRKMFDEGGRIFVGYNNYQYDNKLFAKLIQKTKLSAATVYKLSNKIINENYRVNSYNIDMISLDTTQEIGGQKIGGRMMPPSLKKLEYGLGENIQETPIPFDEPLDQFSKPLAIKYCTHDVNCTEQVFLQRKAYYEGKMDLIKEFNMTQNPMSYMRKTRASLSCIALEADPDKEIRITQDDFNYTRPDNVPQFVLDYFDSLKYTIDEVNGIVKNPEPFMILWEDGRLKRPLTDEEKKSDEFFKNNYVVTLGGGGIHGARNNSIYKSDDEWVILAQDYSSYYPHIIMNNNWFSRKCRAPLVLKKVYDGKENYKVKGNIRKSNVYKIILNAYYGSLGGRFTTIYDPVHRLNVCIEGQARILELTQLLSDNIEIILVQQNTDAVYYKIRRRDVEKAKALTAEFEAKYHYRMDFDEVASILQRDVNNYIEIQTNGKAKTKGFLATINFEDGTVIDGMNKAAIKSALHGVPNVVYKHALNNVLGTDFEATTLDYFMLCAGTRVSVNYLCANPEPMLGKSGRPLKGKFHSSKTEAMQKFNRYYASNGNERMIIVNKNGQLKPKTPENVRIHNQKVDGLPEDLDYSWYEEKTKLYELELASYSVI